MTIPNYIRVKGFIWKLIPYPYATAQAIYPYVLVPDFVYKDLCSSKPSLKYIALLKHEETHLKRQKAIGIVTFIVKYLFSRKFRYTEELIAYRREQKFLKEHGSSLNIDYVASNLSGPVYLWAVNFEKAKEELSK